MYFNVYGPNDASPVVFLHGSMVAGWMWMGQVEDLAGYRCIVPDLPGIGRSASTPWISLSDTSDEIAGMIRNLCPGGRVHVVGLSLGGIAALHVVSQYPELVESLIVSGVPYGNISPGLRLLSQAMLKLYHRPWGARLIAKLFGIPADESLDAFLKTAQQTDPVSLQKITREVMSAPVPENLLTVSVPTLAVVGENDTAPARLAVNYLKAVMPNVASYTVPGVGHQWNAENRALFSEMVRLWIDSRTVPRQFLPI